MKRPTRGAESIAFLALLAGATCIGLAPAWVRWSEVGPVATAFYRLALALPILGLWARRERERRAPAEPGPSFPNWVIAAGTCFALDLGAWHLSIQWTSVANATLLANFAPIVVTLGAWWFLGERVGRRFFMGMSIALAGAWLLTGAGFQGDSGRLLGDALGLVTAVFYGAYQLCVARLRRFAGPARVLWWSSLVSTPTLALIAIALGEPMIPSSLRGWGVVLGLALTAQVLGQGLITFGFANLPAGFSSLTLLVQPLVATLVGWRAFGERLAVTQAIGALVLLAGLHVARTRRAHRAAPREPESSPPPGTNP